MDNTRSIVFHVDARREADEAFDLYHERSPRVAVAFLSALERAVVSIQNSPDSWAKYRHGTRRYLLRRYPFVVVYRATEHRIEIIAVAHGHRKAGYWAERLTPSSE